MHKPQHLPLSCFCGATSSTNQTQYLLVTTETIPLNSNTTDCALYSTLPHLEWPLRIWFTAVGVMFARCGIYENCRIDSDTISSQE